MNPRNSLVSHDASGNFSDTRDHAACLATLNRLMMAGAPNDNAAREGAEEKKIVLGLSGNPALFSDQAVNQAFICAL